MTYRFVFSTDVMVRKEKVQGQDKIVMYADRVYIREPEGMVKFPDCSV